MGPPWQRFYVAVRGAGPVVVPTLSLTEAANQLRVKSKRLWRRIEHCAGIARQRDEMTNMRVVGIDETSFKKGHHYVTEVHDLESKRLLFITPVQDHEMVEAFKEELVAYGGVADNIKHVCMDMSAARTKGWAKVCQRPKSATTAFT